jgi:hypothetical protein
VADISLDPVEVRRFLRLAEDQSDVSVLGIDRNIPDRWTIFVACASKVGRDLLESEW